MNYQAISLTDLNLLSEIYHLRVLAWQHLGIITPERFPNGWFDNLDLEAQHWIIQHEKQIIASARVNILDNPKKLPYPQVFEKYLDFKDEKFAFYSRLVVHPDYQGFGLSKLLDKVRMDFLSQIPDLKFIIATSGDNRLKSFINLGFENLGIRELSFINEEGFVMLKTL